MKNPFRSATEGIARRTTRRGFFGRGAEIAFGALAGAAAGTALRPGGAIAGANTICAFPFGRPCPCQGCQSNGICAKPCIIYTFWYATGCWVTTPQNGPAVTCCDCHCQGMDNVDVCGCGTDWHSTAAFCPDGTA